MKRKEQNRAAQRAFRERKEKHVKDVGQALYDQEPIILLNAFSSRIKLQNWR